MRKFTRGAEPPVLQSNAAKWNAQWKTLSESAGSHTFKWYSHEGKSAREHILPHLREQSAEHCCFCDAFPVAGVSNETIEHLRPKSRFPGQAYTWTNLYYCCDACQNSKREDWDDLIVHADASDYSFSRYFEFDFTTGEIKPNSTGTADDQRRAAVTIRLYGLDAPARRRNRLLEARRLARHRDAEIVEREWAYRDFLGLS